MQPATSLTGVAERGDSAAGTLFRALYSKLHGVARRELARRGRPASLGVTTVVHEAYLDMSGRDQMAGFSNQEHFINYAARVMRSIIVDHSRSRGAVKRGGEFRITSLEENACNCAAESRQLSHIREALEQLERVEPELAEVVDLKFFLGFSFVEIAAMQNVSERSVQRRWERARIYLYCAMREGQAGRGTKCRL